MDRRAFLATTAMAAAGTATTGIARAAAGKTFVLVHGAWHGGWCWSKVASILRGRGHTVVTPTKLATKVGNGLPASYIVCTDPIYKPLEASRDWIKAAGWKTIEIKAGHDAMVIAPERLADLLDVDQV